MALTPNPDQALAAMFIMFCLVCVIAVIVGWVMGQLGGDGSEE